MKKVKYFIYLFSFTLFTTLGSYAQTATAPATGDGFDDEKSYLQMPKL